MKLAFGLCVIAALFVSTAFAQSPTTNQTPSTSAAKPANTRWGWFQPEKYAYDLMLLSPGWRVQNRGTNAEGWNYVLFSTTDYSKAVSYQILHGLIGGVRFMFSENSPDATSWITAEFERIGENEWLDRANNARIKRYYDGNLVKYNVNYEPLAQD